MPENYFNLMAEVREKTNSKASGKFQINIFSCAFF